MMLHLMRPAKQAAPMSKYCWVGGKNDKRRIEQHHGSEIANRNDQPILEQCPQTMTQNRSQNRFQNAKQAADLFSFPGPLEDSPIRRLRVPIRASDWPLAPVARRFCFTFDS